MYVKVTLCDSMDYTVYGILQARILEWVAIPFSRGSSQPRSQPRSPILQVNSLPSEPPGKIHLFWPPISSPSILLCQRPMPAAIKTSCLDSWVRFLTHFLGTFLDSFISQIQSTMKSYPFYLVNKIWIYPLSSVPTITLLASPLVISWIGFE